jgi:hypothetical protein
MSPAPGQVGDLPTHFSLGCLPPLAFPSTIEGNNAPGLEAVVADEAI